VGKDAAPARLRHGLAVPVRTVHRGATGVKVQDSGNAVVKGAVRGWRNRPMQAHGQGPVLEVAYFIIPPNWCQGSGPSIRMLSGYYPESDAFRPTDHHVTAGSNRAASLRDLPDHWVGGPFFSLLSCVEIRQYARTPPVFDFARCRSRFRASDSNVFGWRPRAGLPSCFAFSRWRSRFCSRCAVQCCTLLRSSGRGHTLHLPAARFALW
jgi:hypothetical protein